MSVMAPDALRTGFEQKGYVAVCPLFDADMILELKTEIARYIRDVVPTMPDTRVYYEDKANPSSLKQVQKIFEYDSYFSDLMNDGIIRQMAEAVLDDEVVPINMQYFNKPAGLSQATPPHQDGYYFHLTPCEAVTGWLALDDVDEENGCIHYVRGSHRSNHFRPHDHTGVLGFSQGITDFGNASDRADTVAFPGPAGTFLMHHARTIHWADRNRSESRSRRAIGFIYYAKRAREDVAAKEAYQKSLDERLTATAKI